MIFQRGSARLAPREYGADAQPRGRSPLSPDPLVTERQVCGAVRLGDKRAAANSPSLGPRFLSWLTTGSVDRHS